MAAVEMGPFDPSGYVPGDIATYPPATRGRYYAGQYWTVDPAGTFDKVPVDVGDRLYVIGPAGASSWAPADVSWLVWELPDVSNPPSTRPPLPTAGCPLGDTMPGWRLVVDAYTNPDDGSRVYGSSTYGDDVYGDADERGAYDWVDVTTPHYSVTINRGTALGDYRSDVDQIVVEAVDDTGRWYKSGPQLWGMTIGDRLRVGVFDPAGKYTPLASGEIERIEDEHDVPPRLLTVEAFGNQLDLVTTLVDWSPPAESLHERIDRLLAAAPWRWGDPTMPATDPALLAALDPADVEARAEMDLTAISAGYIADTDRYGNLRFREWPLPGTGLAAAVADCTGHPFTVDELRVVNAGEERVTAAGAYRVVGVAHELPAGTVVAPVIYIAEDYETLLNNPIMGNGRDRVEAVNWSTAGYGLRADRLGFPVYGTYAELAAMRAIVERIAATAGDDVRRVAGFDLDTAVDPAAVRLLAGVDTGRAVDVYRLALLDDYAVSAVVVGYEHRIEYNRWTATINTRTIGSIT